MECGFGGSRLHQYARTSRMHNELTDELINRPCRGYTVPFFDEPMLFPTRHKTPLPREHSYPIGAQAISNALTAIPQSNFFEVSFHAFAKTTYGHTGRYLVVTAEYRHLHVGLSSARWMIENGWYEPQWHLIVYAVPRSDRHNVNEALITLGLAEIEKWLSEPRTRTWLDSSHRLNLEFEPISCEMISVAAV